jgi:predicted porin
MQRKVLALMIPALLMAGAAHAAEIYNKDGNKLDLYGKVDGLHYFSDDKGADGDQTYMRLGFKGETQINDMMTGYAQWEYNVQANNTEGSDNQSWTRLAFAVSKWATTVHSITAVTTACCTTWKAGPICCQSSAATPTPKPITS